MWGTFGILYNKTMVDEKDVDSWDVLWNKKYAGNIQMLDSVRDTMGISLIRLGYSINTQKTSEIEEAKNELNELISEAFEASKNKLATYEVPEK